MHSTILTLCPAQGPGLIFHGDVPSCLWAKKPVSWVNALDESLFGIFQEEKRNVMKG